MLRGNIHLARAATHNHDVEKAAGAYPVPVSLWGNYGDQTPIIARQPLLKVLESVRREKTCIHLCHSHTSEKTL